MQPVECSSLYEMNTKISLDNKKEWLMKRHTFIHKGMSAEYCIVSEEKILFVILVIEKHTLISIK